MIETDEQRLRTDATATNADSSVSSIRSGDFSGRTQFPDRGATEPMSADEPDAAAAGAPRVPAVRLVHGVRRVLYLIVAAVFFALGLLGAVLPGLPATPFLLLCSYFLLRTSPRLNAALRRSRFFGPILVDWQEHGGVRQHVKLKAIVVVAVAVAVTIVASGYSAIATLGVVSLAAIGVAVILRLPVAG